MFLIFSNFLRFWYQKKVCIFLITLVNLTMLTALKNVPFEDINENMTI